MYLNTNYIDKVLFCVIFCVCQELKKIFLIFFRNTRMWAMRFTVCRMPWCLRLHIIVGTIAHIVANQPAQICPKTISRRQ